MLNGAKAHRIFHLLLDYGDPTRSFRSISIRSGSSLHVEHIDESEIECHWSRSKPNTISYLCEIILTLFI